MHFARNLIIFKFNFWFGFQQQNVAFVWIYTTKPRCLGTPEMH